MPMSTASLKDLLTPGLKAVTGKYREIPTQFSQVFKKDTSDKAVERTAEVRMLGLPTLKAEGASIQFDNNAGEKFLWLQTHNTVAMGYSITKEAIEDNLYQRQFPTANLEMQKSFRQFKEVAAANVLNLGNVLDPTVGGDGVPMISTLHPYEQGVWANRPAIDVDLGESTLLAAQMAIPQYMVTYAGLRVLGRARKLVVPRPLEAVAIRLTKTEKRPGTNENDVNAITSVAGGLPEGYAVMDFLTSPFAWFLLTDQDGLSWMERIGYETDMQVDFTTYNLLVKGRERYSFSYFNPRAIYGTYPTA